MRTWTFILLASIATVGCARTKSGTVATGAILAMTSAAATAYVAATECFLVCPGQAVALGTAVTTGILGGGFLIASTRMDDDDEVTKPVPPPPMKPLEPPPIPEEEPRDWLTKPAPAKRSAMMAFD